MMEKRAGRDDWAVEAEVLAEAAATLGQWAKRLPEDSPWREAFAGWAGDVAGWAELTQMRLDRAA